VGLQNGALQAPRLLHIKKHLPCSLRTSATGAKTLQKFFFPAKISFHIVAFRPHDLLPQVVEIVVYGMTNDFLLFIFHFHTHGIDLLVPANRISVGSNSSRRSGL
jgi:hypothetical protein